MSYVVIVVGQGEPRTEELRESGVRSGGCSPERSAANWLQKVLVRPLLEGEREGRESNTSDKVHLVEGLPPLPRKTVKRIQRGEFVEFTEFPIFDGGRKEGSWLVSKPEKTEESPERLAGESRRRAGPREVPDASWWGTCFSLFEKARLETKPELADQLRAYREAIAETARRHRWECVARYDRCFRMAAAGRPDRSWAVMDAALLVRELTLPTAGQARGGSGYCSRVGGSAQAGSGQKRDRRQPGACFRYNKGGSCGYGQQCRFAHTCSGCGGDHPATRCPKGPKSIEAEREAKV